MANINNSQLSKELVEGAKIQTSFDKIPTQLADKVVPVMEVNPKAFRICNICKRSEASNATTATVYVTPADKDFFISDSILSVIKDVTSTSVLSFITCVIDGQTVSINTIAGITLTPQAQQSNMSYNKPIKVDRGTNIVLNNNAAVANIRSSACIIGYTTEQG